MLLWAMGGLFGLLVLAHMAKPRGESRVISSLQFFSDTPPPARNESRLQFSNPLLSPPFFLQSAVLLSLLLALLLSDVAFPGVPAKGFRLWVLIDRSASMSVAYDGGSAMDLAKAQVLPALGSLKLLKDHLDLKVHYSTFDEAVHDDAPQEDGTALPQFLDLETAEKRIKGLQPGFLGSDLGKVRQAMARLNQENNPFTHVLVLTDQPAPDWLAAFDQAIVIWLDVAYPIPNAGITGVEASRDPLTGLVRGVTLELTAFGEPPNAELLIGGEPPAAIHWLEDNKAYVSFSPKRQGRCEIQLKPGGAYSHDDLMVLNIPDSHSLQVDWRLSDRELPRQLGWRQDEAKPHLRVVRAPDDLDEKTPTLVLGAGYGGGETPIADFQEASPLLEDINLDALERAGIRGNTLSTEWRPVVLDERGLAWLALRDAPQAALVPGLPQVNGTQYRVAATLFFNAARHLLRERPLDPLFTATSLDRPEPDEGEFRLAFHPEESDTMRQPKSHGSMNWLQIEPIHEPSAMTFPLLALALLILAVERCLAAFGGRRWR